MGDVELIHAALQDEGIVADVIRVETQADFLAALAQGVRLDLQRELAATDAELLCRG